MSKLREYTDLNRDERKEYLYNNYRIDVNDLIHSMSNEEILKYLKHERHLRITVLKSTHEIALNAEAVFDNPNIITEGIWMCSDNDYRFVYDEYKIDKNLGSMSNHINLGVGHIYRGDYKPETGLFFVYDTRFHEKFRGRYSIVEASFYREKESYADYLKGVDYSILMEFCKPMYIKACEKYGVEPKIN